MVSCLKYDKDDIKVILNNHNGLPFLSVITFHSLVLSLILRHYTKLPSKDK